MAFGYNGFPYNIDDNKKSWGNLKTGKEPKDVKYPYGELLHNLSTMNMISLSMLK